MATNAYQFVTGRRAVAFWRLGAVTGLLGALSACNSLPGSGPSRDEVATTKALEPTGSATVQVVPVTESIARQLIAQRTQRLFSDTLPEPTRGGTPTGSNVGPGDALEVTIWEAPPATLFGGGGGGMTSEGRASAAISTSRGVSLPEQVISREGTINVPFAGHVPAAGKTTTEIEEDIARRLRGKANQPQVMVRTLRNVSWNVTIVGDVGGSTRVPLGPRSERILDALAAAGGVKYPVNKMTLQVTRGNTVASMPLDNIIRDPRQNVLLQPGDVITALHEPLSFTAMGATGKNDEVNFEAQGISLAQALARVGGLQDQRADPQGVFIFRYENPQSITWPRQPVGVTAEGKVPVIYTVNLKDPASFFVMQTFGVHNKDLIYVSNAPIAEFQKFANVVFSIAFPVINTISVTR